MSEEMIMRWQEAIVRRDSNDPCLLQSAAPVFHPWNTSVENLCNTACGRLYGLTS